MRRFLCALFLPGIALAAAQPAPALASNTWCDTDPVVIIATPAGNLVPVYVTNGALGLEHLPATQAARTSYVVHAIPGELATRVVLTSTVPDDAFGSGFPTRSFASSGPMASGTVYGGTTGTSGLPMTYTFDLPVP